MKRGLLSLLEKLTGDERVDNAVRRYCKNIIAEWEKAWTGRESPLKKLRLIHYVPARFSVELTPEELEERARRARNSAKEMQEPKELDRFEPVEGTREEDVFDKLLKLGKGRLCVSEGPGAGKSIFSRRLQAYLCTCEAQEKHFDGGPALVVRWEESPDRKGVTLPEDFEEGFAKELAPHLEKGENAKEVTEQLLRENRVVLILDALDQVTNLSEAALNRFLLRLEQTAGGSAEHKCQFVFTSRPYADALVRGRADAFCRMARIERFDVRQQYAYLFGPVASFAPIGGAWLERPLSGAENLSLIPAAKTSDNANSDQVENSLRSAIRSLIPAKNDEDPIVSSPQSLFLIREFCAEQLAKNQSVKVRFRSLGVLYGRVCRDSLARAYQNSTGDRREVDSEILDWLEAMLGAMAMQMLVTHPRRFSFGQEPNDDLSLLKSRAIERVTLTRPAMAAKFKEALPWTIVTEVSQLTNRLTGIVLDEKSLSWPDPRMKEYYAARHLVKNKQGNWVDRSKPDAIGCGDVDLQKNAANPQWSNVWSLAFDLAEAGKIDNLCFAAGTRHLFDAVRQPRSKKGEPQEYWTRPTRLMYRAWALFRETECEDIHVEGQKILTSFQNQFTHILTNGESIQARIAAQLVPEFILREILRDERRLVDLLPAEYEASFVRCPPFGDSGVFWMGSHTTQSVIEWGIERPRHPVRLLPFWLQSTSVTCEQYALFDPAFAESSENKQDFEFHANEWDCPVIRVNWFDAMIFAFWSGNMLPTEAQREFASRAGRDGERELFGIANIDGHYDGLTTQVANIRNDFTNSDTFANEKKIEAQGEYAGTTLPVRWDARRRASYLLENDNGILGTIYNPWQRWQIHGQVHEWKRIIPPAFRANAWKLWQMQGNVWEWCCTVFNEDAYMARAKNLLPNADCISVTEVEEMLSKIPLTNVQVLEEQFCPCDKARRVLRGGSWNNDGYYGRAADRNRLAPEVRESYIGFRLCRSLRPLNHP